MLVKYFKNYGDVNFFDHGVLVEVVEHDNITEPADDRFIHVIYCRPFYDEPEYLFADLYVDISDLKNKYSWIDINAVLDFTGLSPDDDIILQAIAAIDFYGVENFSGPYDGYIHNYDYIMDFLKYRGPYDDDTIFENIF